MDKIRKNSNAGNEKIYTFIVIAVILNSLGFPGNYTEIFGDWFGVFVDYGCFLGEILVMLLSSADSFLDIVVVNLEKKYRGIYFIVFVFVIESMLVTGYPGEQLVTCLRFATMVFFMLWICGHYSEEHILLLICMAQTWFVLFALVFCALDPSTAFSSVSGESSFVGLHSTKNAAAKELSFGILFFMVYIKNQYRNKQETLPIFYLVLIIQIIMLVFCNAMGAFLTFLITAAYVFFFAADLGKNRRIPLAWMFILGSVLFLITALTILPLFGGLLDMLGKDTTLTGRTELWNAVIDMMKEYNTLTGFGYGMFWRDESAVETLHSAFAADSFMGNMSTGSHNLLLELWLNVGLIGIAALFWGMSDCMRQIRDLSLLQYEICSVIFMLCMLSGFTERSFASAYLYDVSFLFLAMGIGCNRELGREK